MTDERHEEAAALYALDLLEGEERATFERLLATDADLRRLVDELRQASTGLASQLPAAAPSPELKTRILASIAQLPQSSASAAPASPSPPAKPAQPVSSDNDMRDAKVVKFPALAWLGWAAAACLAVSTVYLNSRYNTARSTLAELQLAAEAARNELNAERSSFAQRTAALQTEVAQLQKAGDIAQLKIAKLASLVGNSPEAVAIAVWNPLKHEGVLTVDNLPLIQQDQDYQLWVIDPNHPGGPVSAGVFAIDARGTAKVHFRPDLPVTAAQFAISRERKGGSAKPEGAIVAAGAL